MIDELDLRLIAELAKDARQTSASLSSKLGISDTTVRHRISRLQKKKVITTTVVPDAEKLGYSIVALISLEVNLADIENTARGLRDHPDIHFVAECTGSRDMFIGVWFRSTQDLTKFVKEFLSKFPGIRRSETYIILNVHKDNIGWLQSLGH